MSKLYLFLIIDLLFLILENLEYIVTGNRLVRSTRAIELEKRYNRIVKEDNDNAS